jgi:hypothetical protein
MTILPVPIPTSTVKKWFENLTKIIRAASELAEEAVKARVDDIRAKRADREHRRQAIASAEALIPLLNSIKFDRGGVADTAKELLSAPSGPVYVEFEKQVKASSAILKEMKKNISDSSQLEARLGPEMQLIRQIETLKEGQFSHKFSGMKFNRYAHGGTPLKSAEREPLVTALDQLVAEVNGKIDQAVKRLHDFVEAEKQKP